MRSIEWAHHELELRAAEDAIWPVRPDVGTLEWGEYSTMKVRRRQRRRNAGFTKAQADSWLAIAMREVSA